MTRTDLVEYRPRGAARDLFLNREREVLIAGPAGTGKSLAALFRVHLACLRHAGAKVLAVRKTGRSLAASTVQTYKNRVAAEAIARQVVRYYGGSQEEPAAYRYQNGSRIVLGGMDKPEKVLSTEYDLVFCDEANELTITDWEVLGTRLRNGVLPWQQQIAACNPDAPSHWLRQRADAGKLRLLHSRHADNPLYVNDDGTLTPEGVDYLGQLDRLTGVRRLRLRDGLWAAAEGVIYEDWDERTHLVDRRGIPDDWPLHITVDFGYTNPLCVQWWRTDPDGRLYLTHEIYQTGLLVEDAARWILQVQQANPGWPEPLLIVDHDAEDRATLLRHLPYGVIRARKTVTPGIEAVQKRLRPATDGRPRLYVLRDARIHPHDPVLRDSGRPTCTAEEFPRYRWAQVRQGADGRLKEEPLKEDDHGMDGVRYRVAHEDLGARITRRPGDPA